MVIYRPHFGSLSDSMINARCFDSVEEMKNYIADDCNSKFQNRAFDASDIILSDESIADPRTGWEDTRYVCITRFGNAIYEHPQCIGFCATVFQAQQEQG